MLEPGDRFDQEYQVTRLLGSGGIHDVYLAEDGNQKPVALKILKPKYRTSKTLINALKAEHEILQRLSHPATVRSYQIRQSEEGVFLVLEYVPGKSLKELIRQHHSVGLPLQLVKPMIKTLASALSEMHEMDWVHGDIKPAHVIVDDDGMRAKWIDFGVACQDSTNPETESKPVFAITPHYVSPERYRREQSCVSDDVFAFALMVYEVISGVPAFGKLAPFQACNANVKPKRLRVLDGAQWRLLEHALNTRRSQRLKSIRELAAGF